MKITTKQALLAVLRKEFAYEGKGDIADVLAYCKLEGIKIDEADVKALFEKTAVFTIESGEDEPDVEIVKGTKGKSPKVKAGAAEEDDAADGEDVADEPEPAVKRKAAKVAAEREERANGAEKIKAKYKGAPAIRSGDGYLAKQYNNRANKSRAAFDDAEYMAEFNASFRLHCYELFHKSHPSAFAEYKAKGFMAEDMAIITKDASDTIGYAGGFLLANTLKSEVLWATEEWGMSRFIARNEIMHGNNTSFPRKTSLPVFAPLSSGAVQSTDIAYDLVTLIPKVGGALLLTPMVLFEQSAVNIGDTIAESLMEAYWNTVDDCYFNGIGTLAYFDQVGLAIGLTGTPGSTTSGSYITASTSSVSSWVQADFLSAMSAVKNVNTARCCWVMSRQTYISGALRLATSLGGNRVDNFLTPQNTFMVSRQERGAATGTPHAYVYGEPVFFSQRMNTTVGTDANKIKAYYGDFITGSIIGHRTQIEVASSTEYAFNKRALATRAFAEWAINICGDGRAAATVCGPIAALQTAS